MARTREHHGKQNKPDSKRQIYADSRFKKTHKQAKRHGCKIGTIWRGPAGRGRGQE
jgi:hypothetical protein